MTDLTHGPVTAEMIPLLTLGRSVLSRNIDNRLVLYGERIMRECIGTGDLQTQQFFGGKCTAFTYIGERDDDGWITAPKGGWKSNPVPGVEVFVRLTSGIECEESSSSNSWGWTEQDDYRIAAFRLADPQPATAPAPADGLEVVAWRRRNPGGVWNYQEAEQRIPRVEQQPLVLKSAADARDAELQAEIDLARAEYRAIDVMLGLSQDRVEELQAEIERLRDALRPFASAAQVVASFNGWPHAYRDYDAVPAGPITWGQLRAAWSALAKIGELR